MKCPKCGYTSFDYLDSCKKCNNSLKEFKAKHGLRSLLFPNRTQRAETPPAAPILTAAAAIAPTLGVPADSAGSTDFGYDFDSEPTAPATAPKAAAVAASGSFDFDTDWDAPSPPETATPKAAAVAVSDSFDFDTDWDAPSAPEASLPQEAAAENDPFEFMQDTSEASVAVAAETEEEAFDFMADPAEPTPGFAAVGDDLDLDLGGDAAAPADLAEEEAFEFDDDWGDSTTVAPVVTAAASQTEDAIPEFVAESLNFADSAAEEALRFNDEFDFSDDELPDLLAAQEDSSTAAKKPGAKEGPSDPFDQRESAPGGLTPAGSTSAEEFPEALPAPESILDPSGAPLAIEEPDHLEAAEVPEALAALPAAFPEAEPAAAAAGLADSLDSSEAVPLPLPASSSPAGAPFFRLGAGAFDLLLLLLIYGLFLAAGKLALFPADQAMAALPLEALADLAIPYFLILFALCFGYFTLFHFLSGQTPGKMIFRLKVESLSGTSLDFAQAFLRSVGGLISLLCAGIGFLLILRAPEHRGWSDRLAGTRVIETPPPPAKGS